MLDVIGDTAGKPRLSDIAARNPPIPSCWESEDAQALAVSLHDEAIAALEPLGQLLFRYANSLFSR
ncbi:MAG: hypothetical protein QM756_41925 [Polyangiaceae bacterium]